MSLSKTILWYLDLYALFRHGQILNAIQSIKGERETERERRREREMDRMRAKPLSCKRLKSLSKHLQSATQCMVRKCIKALQSLCRNIALCKRPANHPPQSLPPADHIVARIRPINVTRVLAPFKRNRLSLSLSLSLSLKSNLLWRVSDAILCLYAWAPPCTGFIWSDFTLHSERQALHLPFVKTDTN